MCLKRCQNFIPFLEATYPEMERKHIPRVHEYALCHFCLYEKAFFVKRQLELYLVGV